MAEIRSLPSNQAYRDNWERIFKPEKLMREIVEPKIPEIRVDYHKDLCKDPFDGWVPPLERLKNG